MYWFIDGCNLIYDWDEFKKLDKNIAMEGLLSQSVSFSEFYGFFVTLVFDASGNENITKDITDHLKLIMCRGNCTADSMIEKLLAKGGYKNNAFVVTNDMALRNIVYKYGCSCVSTKNFKEHLIYAAKEQKNKLSSKNWLNSTFFNKLERYF